MSIVRLFGILSIGCLISVSQAKERLDILDVPKSLNEFCVSDGSSLYIFYKNGDFRLEPYDLHYGRIIEGKWTFDPENDPRVFTITGDWKWFNGVHMVGDIREMEVFICTLWNSTDTHYSMLSGQTFTVYDAYFMITRLEKVKLPNDKSEKTE